MKGQFSDENGFKHFFMLFGTKRGPFLIFFLLLENFENGIGIRNPKGNNFVL